MNWLVYQSVIVSEKQEIQGNALSNNVQIAIHIRNVVAETKEEAIGKFILDTSKQSFKSRIDPIECFELGKLKTI